MADKDINVPNKNDFISREAEIRFFDDWVDDLDKQINDSMNQPHLRSDYKVCKTQLLDCIHAVKEMQPADVRPVVRGKWKKRMEEKNTPGSNETRPRARKVVKTEGKMHTGDWSAVSVRCPFWRGETSQAICCEGPSRGELVRRIFLNKALKKDLKKRLCCGGYESCVVYKMVWATYDETSGL